MDQVNQILENLGPIMHSIVKLSPKRGDLVVVRLKDDVEHEQVQAVRDGLKRALPNNRIMVVCGEIKFETLEKRGRMKKSLLMLSAASTFAATALASYATLSFSANMTPATTPKLFFVAAYLGLLGIGLFFVGWAAPKE